MRITSSSTPAATPRNSSGSRIGNSSGIWLVIPPSGRAWNACDAPWQPSDAHPIILEAPSRLQWGAARGPIPRRRATLAVRPLDGYVEAMGIGGPEPPGILHDA